MSPHPVIEKRDLMPLDPPKHFRPGADARPESVFELHVKC